MLERCPRFDAVLAGRKKPGELRYRIDIHGATVYDDENKPIPGGSVFARPIGQFIIAEVLKNVGVQRRSIPDAIDALMENISMDIDQEPWVGVIWNSNTHQITANRTTRTLLVHVLSHALGLRIVPKVRELTQTYRDTVGNRKATVPPIISWSGSTMVEEVADDVPTASVKDEENIE